jgi:pimeloyl-ACP methyl ester carboxylesterase
MDRLKLEDGNFVSYERYGSGPPLVLVHGSMSDHETNWGMLKGALSPLFTIYAMDRRGRGETTAPTDRTLEDEFGDVAAMIRHVGQPTFVLGHSFGAHCAMGGATAQRGLVSKLVLYEPPVPNAMPDEAHAQAEEAADRGDWDSFVRAFLLGGPKIPAPAVDALRASPFWPPMVADAPATLADIRALSRYAFDPARFSTLTMPVLLLVGSESPRDNYVTDSLANILPDAGIVEFAGQGHVAHAMVPQMFVEAISTFLLGATARTS